MPCDKPSKSTSSIITTIAVIILALYIISPIDLIPDIIPVIGWIDDIIALMILIGLIMTMLD